MRAQQPRGGSPRFARGSSDALVYHVRMAMPGFFESLLLLALFGVPLLVVAIIVFIVIRVTKK